MPVHLDFEARSKRLIERVGAYRWLEDPSSRLLCLAYSIDGEEPRLWHPTFPLVPEELQDPDASFVLTRGDLEPLFERIREGDELWAHNAQFERAVFELVAGPRLGWPVPRPDQWRCTQAMCAAFSLPLRLESASAALGLLDRKDSDGSVIMKKLAKPRKPTKKDSSLWHEDPKDLEKLFAYCRQDVKTEMAIHRALRPLSSQELRVYHVDQAVNARGVHVDLELCCAAARAAEERSIKLERETEELTGGAVRTFRQVTAARKWMAARGVELPDLQAETVRDELAHDDAVRECAQRDDGHMGEVLPQDVRRFLELRAAGAKSSIAKYGRLLAMVSRDGRFRGGYQYHGAGTGRWAGRGVQLQNFPRGATKAEQLEVIEAVKEGGLPLLELLWPDPISKLSRVLRGALIPAPGCKLIVADFAAIEARGVLWMAGQEDALDVFRRGEDPYCYMAADIYDGEYEDIRHRAKVLEEEHGSRQRFVGKQTVLGAGYGMGPERFVAYCAGLGVTVSNELGEKAISRYRKCFAPKVPKLWKLTEAAAIRAVQNPGLQTASPRAKWKVVGRFLHCQLPSGRLLSYYRPHVREVTAYTRRKVLEDGTVIPRKPFQAQKLFYYTARGGGLGRVGTFGGMLVENICQGLTRDLTADRMVKLEDIGWNIVMHSHDEVACEERTGSRACPELLKEILEQAPAWADGLPVKAEAWEGDRYRK